MKTIVAIKKKLPIAPAIDARDPTTELMISLSFPAVSPSEGCIF